MIDPNLLKRMMMGEYAQNEKKETKTTSKGNNKKILDLHIEKIHPKYKKLNPNECLDFQINFLKNYLSEMRKVNVKSIEIIYGIGEGTLRKKVGIVLESTLGIRKYSLGPSSSKVTFH